MTMVISSKFTNPVMLLLPGCIKRVTSTIGYRHFLEVECDFASVIFRTEFGSAKIELEKLEHWFDEDNYSAIDAEAERCGRELEAANYWWPLQ